MKSARAAVVALILLLASSAAWTDPQRAIRVGQHINLSPAELEPHIIPPASLRRRFDSLEFVVYYYSEGVERFDLAGADEIRDRVLDGAIRIMVLCRKNGLLQKVRFVEGRGQTKDAILRALSRRISAL